MTLHRRDGEGDGWANEHRTIDPHYTMVDIDHALISGEDIVYCETKFADYRPDQLIRDFSLKAVFERKKQFPHSDITPQTGFLFWLCRKTNARFFWVLGPQEPPWKMIELNPRNGTQKQEFTIHTRGEIRSHWRRIGLLK